jgi:DNA-binding beta-propeller fold protein YncE
MLRSTSVTASLLMTSVIWLTASAPRAQETQPLRLEATIPLGEVRGRIDHMAIDLPRQRLFVAELGNDSVGVVDLKERRVVHRISGLSEPQGVGYLASTDTLYVANGGDGSLRLFAGAQYAAEARIALGSDADNVRIDSAGNRVIVGYGGGALAVIDAASRGKVADIRLKGHPESFQLSQGASRAFVNVPNAHEIAVVDLTANRQIAAWPMRIASANFPMALDEEAARVLNVFRSPAKVGVFSMQDGSLVGSPETCGDADDIFVDPMRHRAYVSCGSGALDVIDTNDTAYRRVARLPTVAGARTAFFSPELDRLYLAVRAQRGEGAAIRIYQPAP